MAEDNIEWKFQSELYLEDFVWNNLESLFQLKCLARQYCINYQICDILAIDEKKQLTILELKNTEDRYVIQQLTRYYDAIKENQPFKENINYQLPIRLLTLAPSFHQHNLIDLKYNKLIFELLTFRILTDEAQKFCFELCKIEKEAVIKLNISKKFHPFLVQASEKSDKSVVTQSRPPLSLRKLTESLSLEQERYVLAIRDRLLGYDERMREKGFTKRTVYGLGKGDKDIYKTKLCAEFIPDIYGFNQLELRLRLPYPKRELIEGKNFYKSKPVKGLTWVEIKQNEAWDKNAAINLLFYLGKGSRYSYAYHLDKYAILYQQITGENRLLQSLDDLLTLALDEWKYLCSLHR